MNIYKYELTARLEDIIPVIGKNVKVLSVGIDHAGSVCAWVSFDRSDEVTNVRIKVLITGDNSIHGDMSKWRFLNTLIVPDTGYIFHFYTNNQ